MGWLYLFKFRYIEKEINENNWTGRYDVSNIDIYKK